MSKERETTPRKGMERAVRVMRESVAEPRKDGKAAPKVGAVLLKQDGTFQTAFRGELRYGDHAEYTLLERKNRDVALDGCILFSTLEPCAPGARKNPKLGCAERIVLARVGVVYVGIEDPDPTIDRKGIKYLQDAGVTVHMFDRDLQEEIVTANSEFLKQARQRASEAEDEALRKVTLSALEESQGGHIEDLSPDALIAFRASAGIADEVGSPAFNRRLSNLNLLDDEHKPTGFGFLLFGREPRTSMQQAGLLATMEYPDGKEDVEDFDGPQVLAPDLVINWLKNKLPNLIDRSSARRTEENAPLLKLVREGVVNALVHRDYSIAGAKCQIFVKPDKIVIMSPGEPITPITLAQMQDLSAPMLSRNPVLHYVFARMDLAEERGLGLKSMRLQSMAAGLPPPRYSWNNPYLNLTLYRSAEAVAQDLPSAALQGLSEEEIRGYAFIAARETVTRREYELHLNLDYRKAQRQLKHFVELGLVQTRGSGPATAYAVVNNGQPGKVSR